MFKHKEQWQKAAKIDWLLNRITGTTEVVDWRPRHFDRWIAGASMRDFSGAVYLFAEGDDQVDVYFNDVTWDCLEKGFDVAACIHQPPGSVHDFVLCRMRHLTLKEMRPITRVSDRVVQLFYGGLSGEQHTAVKYFFEYLPDGRWIQRHRDRQAGVREIGNGIWMHDRMDMQPEPVGTVGTSFHYVLTTLMSVAFAQQYQWRVRFSNDKGFSIQIACHPRNIAKLFSLREKYTDRRKALRHLTTSHWRMLSQGFPKTDFDVQTFVRTHLRGQQSFDWFGLRCDVVVPVALRTDVERQKMARAEMRKAEPRSDRRYLFASAAR